MRKRYSVHEIGLENIDTDDCMKNRFDIRYGWKNPSAVHLFLITNDNASFKIPVYLSKNRQALLGLWMSSTDSKAVIALSKYLRKKFNIKVCLYEQYKNPLGCYQETNHWKVDLQTTSGDIIQRLSKRNRNRFRQRRKIVEKLRYVNFLTAILNGRKNLWGRNTTLLLKSM